MADMPKNMIEANAGFQLFWNDAHGNIEWRTFGKGVLKSEVSEIIKYLKDMAKNISDTEDCCGNPRSQGSPVYLPELTASLGEKYVSDKFGDD
jgi:hypothetical protein